MISGMLLCVEFLQQARAVFWRCSCISKSVMAMCSRRLKTNAQLTFFVAGAVPGHWLRKHGAQPVLEMFVTQKRVQETRCRNVLKKHVSRNELNKHAEGVALKYVFVAG